VESSCERGNESSVYKMLGNYRMAAQLVTSRVVLSSTELVSGAGVEPSPLLLRPLAISLLYQPWMVMTVEQLFE
jgi:hypothetical protein